MGHFLKDPNHPQPASVVPTWYTAPARHSLFFQEFARIFYSPPALVISHMFALDYPMEGFHLI